MYSYYSNSNTQLGNNCELLELNGSFYRLDQTNNSYSQVMSNGSSWSRNRTSNINYYLEQGTIYKYNMNTNEFVEIFQLPNDTSNSSTNTPYYTYELEAFGNRIIAYRFTNNPNYVYSPSYAYINNLKYNIFILKEENFEVSMIDTINFEASTQEYRVKINISPELTKIHYQYLPFGADQPVVAFKTIDYSTLYAYDVNFIDLPNYIPFILVNHAQSNSSYNYSYNSSASSNSSNFTIENVFVLLEDEYFIVRNDNIPDFDVSPYNHYSSNQSHNVPNKVYKQKIFKFGGINLV